MKNSVNIFKYVKTANVQCDNVKPFTSGGLTLPAMNMLQ